MIDDFTKKSQVGCFFKWVFFFRWLSDRGLKGICGTVLIGKLIVNVVFEAIRGCQWLSNAVETTVAPLSDFDVGCGGMRK